MQADVGKIRSHMHRGMEPGDLIDAECRPISPEQFKHRLSDPTGLAKFEGIATFARERCQELVEPLDVDLPLRWELEEDGPQLSLESLRAREKVFQRILWVLEFFIVSQKAAGLYSKDKIVRHSLPPCFQRRQRG